MKTTYNSNLLWLTENSYSFLSLLCNFWMDYMWYILEKIIKKNNNVTVPIFCKAHKTVIYNLMEAMHSKPYVLLWFSTLLPSLRIRTFHWDLILPIMQFWWALHISRDCSPGFLSEMDFKVPTVIKDEKERYLTLFSRPYQKEQRCLWRQAPSFHIAEFAEDRVEYETTLMQTSLPLQLIVQFSSPLPHSNHKPTTIKDVETT